AIGSRQASSTIWARWRGGKAWAGAPVAAGARAARRAPGGGNAGRSVGRRMDRTGWRRTWHTPEDVTSVVEVTGWSPKEMAGPRLILPERVEARAGQYRRTGSDATLLEAQCVRHGGVAFE